MNVLDYLWWNPHADDEGNPMAYYVFNNTSYFATDLTLDGVDDPEDDSRHIDKYRNTLRQNIPGVLFDPRGSKIIALMIIDQQNEDIINASPVHLMLYQEDANNILRELTPRVYRGNYITGVKVIAVPEWPQPLTDQLRAVLLGQVRPEIIRRFQQYEFKAYSQGLTDNIYDMLLRNQDQSLSLGSYTDVLSTLYNFPQASPTNLQFTPLEQIQASNIQRYEIEPLLQPLAGHPNSPNRIITLYYKDGSKHYVKGRYNPETNRIS